MNSITEARQIQTVLNQYDSMMNQLNSNSIDIVARHAETKDYFDSLGMGVITNLGAAHTEMLKGIENVGSSIDGLYAPGQQQTSKADAQAQAQPPR